ncbi:hypothetical protein E6C27_scaffold1505G00070 [Cucumis melo var. makuwa]|uniref:Uncharacterized protein n=1 Tax=Cucumis melo var. makuwa TaxID=1194695 RepID=A0A5A7V7X4_CUCMM|nr:hypothetical protein E6C27_scaffold1505G00070 [Cucumis melo var. makuwa]
MKVHSVLPSSRWYCTSSWRIQFHQVHVRDSRAVVTPFVQVGTYATRNFATLGQLEYCRCLPGLPFKAYHTSPFDLSASNRVILLSFFNMVLSSTVIYSTCSPMSVWGTTHKYGDTLSQDPYSKANTGMRKACRLIRLNETFENGSVHFQLLRKPHQSSKATRLGRVRKALMTQGEFHNAGKESEGKRGLP